MIASWLTDVSVSNVTFASHIGKCSPSYYRSSLQLYTIPSAPCPPPAQPYPLIRASAIFFQTSSSLQPPILIRALSPCLAQPSSSSALLQQPPFSSSSHSHSLPFSAPFPSSLAPNGTSGPTMVETGGDVGNDSDIYTNTSTCTRHNLYRRKYRIFLYE